MAVSKPKIFSASVPEHLRTCIYLVRTQAQPDDSVTPVPSRPKLALHRNFNDFAADVTSLSGRLPKGRLLVRPITQRHQLQRRRALILLTFDETETYTVNNPTLALLLLSLRVLAARSTRPTTRITSLSTMEANWGLRSPCFADVRLTNITSTIPGPLNVQYYVPIMAPNTSAIGAGGGPTFVTSGVDTSFRLYCRLGARAPQPHRTGKDRSVVRPPSRVVVV
ncbi:hypothetical protein EDB89DRAFT_2230874 [Lactarius sanguifluus]|nr:hypothetical protein EDB89DRAFT_2230874 [Lactarius sanguifluus]